MRFSWKPISVFGRVVLMPMIRLLESQAEQDRRQATSAALNRLHLNGIRECKRCEALFKGRAGVGMALHLQDHHAIDEDAAIKIVDDLYHKFLEMRRAAIAAQKERR